MGKKKRKPKIHRDDQGEFRWEVYFVRGKEKRRKIRMLDGKDFDYDQCIRANADDVWLVQEGHYDIMHESEMERRKLDDSEKSISTISDVELPF